MDLEKEINGLASNFPPLRKIAVILIFSLLITFLVLYLLQQNIEKEYAVNILKLLTMIIFSLDEKSMYSDDLLGFYDGFEGDYYEQDYYVDQV